ncbi:MAG TPA: ABC transporter permease [Polyangiaceae bacterium]
MTFVDLLLLAAPLTRTKTPKPPPNFFVRTWEAIPLGLRIAVLVGLGLLFLFLLVWGLIRLGRGRFRLLLWILTGACFLGVTGLGAWALSLPQGRGASFVVWHQIVRIGVVVCGMGFVLGGSALALPRILDLFEGGSFVGFVAARHVRSSKSGFLTIISVLSILGVWLSSLALCLVVSIMGGFGADLKRKILGNNAHIKIESIDGGGFQHYRDLLESVRKIPDVRAATPVAGGEAMASSSSNTAGVLLRGIDPKSIGTVIDLVTNIEVGRFDYLTDTKRLARLPPDEPIGLAPNGEPYRKGPGLKFLGDAKDDKLDPAVDDAVTPEDAYPGIVLGRELAKTLHVYVGDEITLVSPLGDLGPMGVLPRSKKFRVAAIFYSGMYEYDASQAYVLIDVAQDFLDMDGKVTALEIRVHNTSRSTVIDLGAFGLKPRGEPTAEVNDGELVSEVAPRVRALTKERKDLRVRDWKELNKNLFSALKLEKIATFVILSLAILVASFCIICTLLLMVTEKSKEIAVLKSLGASDRAILSVFMTEGMMIGGIGTIVGVATGLSAALGLKWFGVRLDPEVYYIDRLPVSVDWTEYLMVALAAFGITTISTLLPATAASKLRPVDGIRYE